jgi:transcriptional regulator with XRE-family HTH domain
MNLSHLGNLLKRARTKYNYSLSELADQAQLEADVLDQVERGSVEPTQAVLDAYAKRFRIDQADIDRLRVEYERARDSEAAQ